MDGIVFGIGCAGGRRQWVSPRSGNPDWLPPSLAFQMPEGEFRIAMVLARAHDVKINLKPVAQRLTPWNAVRGHPICGQEIQHREDETGLMGLLMPEAALPHHVHIQSIQGLHRLFEGGKERTFTTGHE